MLQRSVEWSTLYMVEVRIEMEIAVLFSGRKESVYATYIAQQWGWRVAALATLAPVGRTPQQYLDRSTVGFSSLLAEAMSSPIIVGARTGDQRFDLHRLLTPLAAAGLDGVVCGAVRSDEYKSHFEHVCTSLELKSFVPLWQKNPRQILDEMFAAGFSILLSGVRGNGEERRFLGTFLDPDRLDRLTMLSRPFQHHLSGATPVGAFSTTVLDGPVFRRAVEIDESERVWDGKRGEYRILDAHLVEKGAASYRSSRSKREDGATTDILGPETHPSRCG